MQGVLRVWKKTKRLEGSGSGASKKTKRIPAGLLVGVWKAVMAGLQLDGPFGAKKNEEA